jgi:hypothetical protein
MTSRVPELFRVCVAAMDNGVPVERASRQDKEFAVQNWVRARLDEAGIHYIESGRNTYPDFPLEGEPAEGIEVKSLAYPGREASYDANSNVPTGAHDGRDIYYLFGRYPSDADERYPLYDLVVCHGDFLNPMQGYVHLNRNIPTFGAYGDIMIRDRKMYVVRTPYDIASGLAGQRTLILPGVEPPPDWLVAVGELERVEAARIAVGYEFDLRTNELVVLEADNPAGGQRHTFTAYRLASEAEPSVTLAERGRPR